MFAILLERTGSARKPKGCPRLCFAVLAAAFVVAAIATARAADDNRTKIKPGVDRFSPQQDVEIGRRVAAQIERQAPLLDDARVNRYLTDLGQRLAANAPGPRFVYEFHCINSRQVNAFALPGGFIFITRGTIEASHNEAQLAGILSHEIAHVALRHGTNQATKQEIWAAIGVAGAVGGGLAGGPAGGIAAGLGGNLAADSVLLKYSRTAETQADVVGTQILRDAGYDPRALGQFFETLEEENGKHPVEFFSDHPLTEHRVDRINEEVDKMGGLPQQYTSDTPEFREIRRYLLTLAAPPPGMNPFALGPPRLAGAPPPPSRETRDYAGDDFRLQYPSNWTPDGQGDVVSFVPSGGMVRDARGKQTAAYGVMISVFHPAPQATLEQATRELIASFAQANPGMIFNGQLESMRLDGESAMSVHLTNDSPRGGRENDWLVTVRRPLGLLYFISIAPAGEYEDYDSAFQQLMASVRLNRYPA